jgi:hypothetical protein
MPFKTESIGKLVLAKEDYLNARDERILGYDNQRIIGSFDAVQ